VQFNDLQRQYARIEPSIRQRIDKVLNSASFIMGPEVRELEQRLASYVGVRHVISCASGTDALVIPLLALRLQREDAVFVPSFTFFATAEAVTLAGGTPVFVDSDPVSFNIDTTALTATIEQVLASGELRPRGIISVDLFGQPADYADLEVLAEKYGLFLLDDAAQAFGSSYEGRRLGGFGNAAATSFFPAKPLGCYGDGGAIFTNDDDLAALCGSIRSHGQGASRYDNVRIGLNGRLDTLQAAVLLAKLEIFDDELKRRNGIAQAYQERLSDVLAVPRVKPGRNSVWAQYTLLASDAPQRDHILAHLREQGIPYAVYYPTPVHLSQAYQRPDREPQSLPVCEDLSRRAFSIPMHPYLEDREINSITAAVREAACA
jgi:dTDP-4-amino-4,6-dideoxygalactose transaminase